MSDQGLVLPPLPTDRARGREPSMLVVALDFGTTFSGYAYSFQSDFKESPLQVLANNFVSRSSATRSESQSPKVPTTILFTPERRFHSFGFEAETKYAALYNESEREANRWFYFERFKMRLHKNRSLGREMALMDFTNKKSMRATDVFAASIRHLKDHLTKTLISRLCPVEGSDISWVLTVPAIWDDQARQFMREAAIQAGIPDKQLELALEPESASVFCQHYLPSLNNSSTTVDLTKEGQKFLVVDCGGGTIDLTVYEVARGGVLKELYRPTGGAWGGTKVDEAFKLFLVDVVGFEGVTEFKRLDMLALYRNFEQVKCMARFPDKVHVELPDSIRDSIQAKLDPEGDLAGKVEIVRSRLAIARDVVEGFFEEPCQAIVRDVENVLNEPSTRGVDTILMVGGFSESSLVQKAVRQAFPRHQTLVPDNPAAAVLKGAVIYRHRPSVIGGRASPLTYGIGVTRFFRPSDLEEKRFTEDGTEYCKDVLSKVITINRIVRVDEEFPVQSFNPLYRDQSHMVIEVFASQAESPQYTTSTGCFKVGEVTVQMPDLSGDRSRKVNVTLVMGGTELKVVARDGNTDQEFKAAFDFLAGS